MTLRLLLKYYYTQPVSVIGVLFSCSNNSSYNNIDTISIFN